MTLRELRLQFVSFLFISGSAFADPAPFIHRHSETNISLEMGDTFETAVDAEGEALVYQWVRDDETICKEPKCTFDTKTWDVGNHLLVLVVRNRFGSLSVKFNVRIATRTPGRPIENKILAMRNADVSIEKLKPDDPGVRTVSGLGYSYNKEKVQVIGQVPRLLEWREKLKTQSSGIIEFGISDREHFVLLPSSRLSLFRIQDQKRVIKHTEGQLRARVLNDHSPDWMIKYGSWLSIIPDDRSDFIVQKSPNDKSDRVQLFILRGTARVQWFKRPPKGSAQGESEPTLDQEMLYSAGTSLELSRAPSATIITVPNAQIITDVLQRTTPFYLTLHKEPEPEISPLPWIYDSEARSKPLSEAKVEARERDRDEDSLGCLEILSKYHSAAEQDFEVALFLGNAYLGIEQYKRAGKYYTLAQKIKGDDPQSAFQIGVVMMHLRVWKKAIRWFERAEQLGSKEKERLSYYRGVASFYMGDFERVREDMATVIDMSQTSEIVESAKEFFGLVQDDERFFAEGSFSYLFDSNVLRLHPDVDSELIPRRSGSGYKADGHLKYLFFKSPSSGIGLGFKIARIGYFSKDLELAQTIDQKIYFNFNLGVGGLSEQTPGIRFNFEPFLGAVVIGEKRADDVIGGHFNIRVLSVWGEPTFALESEVHLDPFPLYDDIIDPITHELTDASERSTHLSTYRLGLSPIKDAKRLLNTQIFMRSSTHRAQARQVEDFSDFGLRLTYEYGTPKSWDSHFGLGYVSRQYKLSEDNRKDGLMGIDAGARVLFWKLMSAFVNADYLKLSSSRDLTAYTRYEILTGMGLSW